MYPGYRTGKKETTLCYIQCVSCPTAKGKPRRTATETALHCSPAGQRGARFGYRDCRPVAHLEGVLLSGSRSGSKLEQYTSQNLRLYNTSLWPGWAWAGRCVCVFAHCCFVVLYCCCCCCCGLTGVGWLYKHPSPLPNHCANT